ncbi:hypothetical protein BDQ12DRAFT_692265 [Crucibulum laeve]|uniref:Uncharacterized protein n=1 Tax=Crucibulum laeve TaxID=68775 RepID=A0A5C3LIX6_9AGAR|nr:hypothetical protein BDQ12DRAFT_692265 [Crucibulum laeve]
MLSKNREPGSWICLGSSAEEKSPRKHRRSSSCAFSNRKSILVYFRQLCALTVMLKLLLMTLQEEEICGILWRSPERFFRAV